MGEIQKISTEEDFEKCIKEAGNNLVILYCSAEWCGPCRQIKPIYENMSTTYNEVKFLKLDIDESEDFAVELGVNALPTFIFYQDKEKIDMAEGANVELLENKIKDFLKKHPSDIPNGCMDLTPLIVEQKLKCLNESDDHPLQSIIPSGDPANYLESKEGSQLIMIISFCEPVLVHYIRISATKHGPKHCKLYADQEILDFNNVDTLRSVEELTLTKDDVSGSPISLRQLRDMIVTTIHMYITTNQFESELTRIDKIMFLGKRAEIYTDKTMEVNEEPKKRSVPDEVMI